MKNLLLTASLILLQGCGAGETSAEKEDRAARYKVWLVQDRINSIDDMFDCVPDTSIFMDTIASCFFAELTYQEGMEGNKFKAIGVRLMHGDGQFNEYHSGMINEFLNDYLHNGLELTDNQKGQIKRKIENKINALGD